MIFLSFHVWKWHSLEKEKAFCVLLSEQDREVCIFMKEFAKKMRQVQSDLDLAQHLQRGRLSMQGKIIWTIANIGRGVRENLTNHL